jgi:general secretion pathway protein L
VARNYLAEDTVTTTLRVFVGEHWPEQPSTRWTLIGAAGNVLQQGESDALRWPVAEYCEAVISAPELSCLRAAIPQRVARRDLPQVIAGVLEDQLLEDPDRCHLTVCRHRGDSADVLVIGRDRLRNILAQFAALGRPLSAAYAELRALHAERHEWVVALATDGVILSRPHEVPLVLDGTNDGTPPALLATIAKDPRSKAGNLRILIRSEAGNKVDLAAWKTMLRTEHIRIGPEYRWYSLTDSSVDLLHDEFVSRLKRNNAWLLIKPAALVAGSFLLAYLVIGLFQVLLSSYRVGQAEGRIEELFASSFPGVPVVSPAAQTRRQLDQLRAAHGLARSDDVLVLLAALSGVLGANGENSLKELNYSDHRLTATFDAAYAERVEGLRQQLQDRGYQATLRSGQPPVLVIELDMTK